MMNNEEVINSVIKDPDLPLDYEDIKLQSDYSKLDRESKIEYYETLKKDIDDFISKSKAKYQLIFDLQKFATEYGYNLQMLLESRCETYDEKDLKNIIPEYNPKINKTDDEFIKKALFHMYGMLKLRITNIPIIVKYNDR